MDRGWDDTLAAALLGAGRAPPAGAPLPGLAPVGEPGAALLARVAAQGLVHLAGTGIGAEAMVPAPERATRGPDCPQAAAARLHALLAAGPSAEARRREWFGLAAAAGVRAPSWLLAELAGLRGGEAALVRAIAGPEIDWLAQACGEGTTEPAADAEAGRYAALLAHRRRDPDGARAVLEAAFKVEKAKLRAALLPVLGEGLGAADEPFLEACLDDRSGDVRAVAQRLLTRLPGSQLAGRMAGRARAALAVEGRRHLLVRTRHDLVVTLPDDSPELARDGVAPSPHERDAGGRRAGLLRDIVGAAPLSAFADHPPRLWIELALRSAWSVPLYEGFLGRVRAEREPAWVQAMVEVLREACEGRLAGTTRADALPEMWAECVALMPAAAWEETVAGLFRSHVDALLAMLAKGTAPYSPAFTDALLDWIALATRSTPSLREKLGRTWIVGRVGSLAAPTGRAAAAAAAILARLPEDADGRLRRQVAEMAETLELRAAMRREFGDLIEDGRDPQA